MQATDDQDDHHFRNGRDEEGSLRTSCHVFIVDPDLCHHQVKTEQAKQELMDYFGCMAIYIFYYGSNERIFCFLTL